MLLKSFTDILISQKINSSSVSIYNSNNFFKDYILYCYIDGLIFFICDLVIFLNVKLVTLSIYEINDILLFSFEDLLPQKNPQKTNNNNINMIIFKNLFS